MASWDPRASNIGIKIEDDSEMQLPVEEPRGAVEDLLPTHKRRRTADGNQNHVVVVEEKEQLEKYEKLESDARKVLQKTYEKLHGLFRGKMSNGMNYLNEQLTLLKEKTSLDPICIGFLGRSGAGKTSLINAIIGKELFLPVSGEKACTSCVVQLSMSRNEYYEATIHLLSEEEWNDELKELVEVLNKSTEDNESGYSGDSVNDAIDKLRALYGSGAEKKSYNELLGTKQQVDIPDERKIKIKEKEEAEFSLELERYICVGKEDSFNLWPLIKYVEVTIPGSDTVPEGITFVDIPGTGDFNKKRDEMWKQSIAKCSVLWIISASERAESESDQKMFLNESIKAYLGGICTDIAMVITKSDIVSLAVHKRERKNKNIPIENKHDAILQRKEEKKMKMENDIKTELERRLPPNSEVINKPDLIYMVSSEEFWEPAHLPNKEDTEIPKLREYVRSICTKEKKKLVVDYVTEVLSILLFAENIGSEHHLMKKHFPESDLKGFVQSKIHILGKKIEQCFEEIKQSLSRGVQNARNNYRVIVEDMLTSGRGNQGFHKTLKAVCWNNGVYSSKMFGRLDFNESLAMPIYEKFEGVFASVFRTQEATGVHLGPPLEMFKNEVQEKIGQFGRDNILPNGNAVTETFVYQIEVILGKLKQDVLQRKTTIFLTFVEAIQEQLKPHYDVASQIKGPRSCNGMKESLRKSIEYEVKVGMFEKAQEKMETQLRELKNMILTRLEEETLSVFKRILWHEQQAVELPDITEQCKAMKEIYGKCISYRYIYHVSLGASQN